MGNSVKRKQKALTLQVENFQKIGQVL